MSIDNRTVAIIGGSSGIGLEVARQVIAQGGRVFIGARDVQRLERAVQVLGPAASGYRVDSADEASVQAFFEAAPALDHLFTPGASYQLGKFVELDEAQARTPLDMKFWGQYRAIRHALPKLREGGSVVLMAGALGARVGMVGAAYAACNAAIETLGRSLAVELAPLRFNTVSPGTIDSDLWRQRPAEQRRAAFDSYAQSAALGRVGTVGEVANAVLFLMGNGFMSGSTLYVDGGFVVKA